MHVERLFLFLVMLLLAVAANQGAAQPIASALKTRWTGDVTPATAHRDYPRPQLTRDRWHSLNGTWEFAPAADGEQPPFDKTLDQRILVPFPVESTLSGIAHRHQRVWYRRHFTVPAGWNANRILLHFEAANWEARVFLNGKPLGSHRGGYDPFTFDITDVLRPGEQELVVGIYNPADDDNQPRGKQINIPNNETFYTAATGLWQSVWLEPVASSHIEELVVTPDVDTKSVSVRAMTSGPQTLKVVARVLEKGKVMAKASGKPGEDVALRLKNPRLWSPDSPFLYDLEVDLIQDERVQDHVGSYFGMRKVSLGRDGTWTRILLNDRFVFQVGPLDQGYWPDGIYTAPTDEALKYDIEMTKRLGFNMIRKHVKVEPRRWYYWADTLGVLVWQDMPFCLNRTPESRTQFAVELRRMIETLRHFPSIVMWVVFNESFGQHDTEQLTAWVKKFDPSRVVNSASGGTDFGVGDVYDQHAYPVPDSRPASSHRASVVGEFGGLGYRVPGHTWNDVLWSYQLYTQPEALIRRYEKLLKRAWELKDEKGISGVVYTQTTDVEAELNGLMTYDRAVLKMDEKRTAAANRGEYVDVPLKMLVPDARTEPQTWRFTAEAPAGNWTALTFDDSTWQRGAGGFGSEGTRGAVISTSWTGSDIWLRHAFTLDQVPASGLVLTVFHDEDAEIYLNGVMAASPRGFTTDYYEIPLTPEVLAALKAGRNVLSVHCHNAEGGQNIDVGLGQP